MRSSEPRASQNGEIPLRQRLLSVLGEVDKKKYAACENVRNQVRIRNIGGNIKKR